MRMLLGPEGALPLEQAKPWRAALHEVMKPQIVMRMQLPIMAALFQVRPSGSMRTWTGRAKSNILRVCGFCKRLLLLRLLPARMPC